MDSDLRRAIRENPSEPRLRLVLGEHSEGRPEAELIRLLMERPGARSSIGIMDWFERNHGWPRRLNSPYCPCADPLEGDLTG